MKVRALSVCHEKSHYPQVVNEWNGFYDFSHMEQAVEIMYDEQEKYTFIDDKEAENSKTYILRKAFNNIIFIERIHQVAYRNALINSNLKEEEDRVEKVFKQLQAALTTKEQQDLLTELEAAWNSMYAVFLEYSYCQGIADSPVIHRELKEFGICVLKECA
ncbi:hypothetical protein [Virgibacillus pantothenticus]|uniref:Uncharacterized protein n=1 Tax=Virgibacillus pantothenticus TaxID=1473 RepID=A0A0L0QLN3_VIRPA|nr:hypothetical protein [Virgibacillus pantothenticus]KNE19439.1 hypothetical protein AFK71_13170 [Virgibacillus pantothenticus]MED3737129.1 hypothetical protein [Virgibacillus pantothenticus]QTY15040.1 hypothetical protein KBP50_14095 [Virgibacillus pantothenticus]SIS76199.1 hypothetical protein SAMN05421787_1035 [Virgibacillus pantothenticus]